uniref:Uncharacterized protein n=1 Tax=Kalanchoe fedtschenkoi TaxID=63787 RepID=A0A7N0RG58_KALFE
MATAVLQPRDCTTKMPFAPDDAFCASRFVPRSKPAGGRKPNSSPNSRRRRRSPSDERSAGRERAAAVTKAAVKEDNELVMGKVRILKRGENLNPNVSASVNEGKSRLVRGRSVSFEKEEDVILCSTDRLGPDPEVLREQMRVAVEDGFAGGVVTSPPPSSVPFPIRINVNKFDAASVALDLRRMLKLDLI